MNINDERRLWARTAALVIFAEYNIPVDVQELLLRGDPSRNIPPDALGEALMHAINNMPELTAA